MSDYTTTTGFVDGMVAEENSLDACDLSTVHNYLIIDTIELAQSDVQSLSPA